MSLPRPDLELEKRPPPNAGTALGLYWKWVKPVEEGTKDLSAEFLVRQYTQTDIKFNIPSEKVASDESINVTFKNKADLKIDLSYFLCHLINFEMINWCLVHIFGFETALKWDTLINDANHEWVLPFWDKK